MSACFASRRSALCALLAAASGCAQGSSPDAALDAQPTVDAPARPDGASDAPAADAPPPDAPAADGPRGDGAPADAPPADAPPVDACTPTQELCNGVDDDCDGMVDEGAVDDFVAPTLLPQWNRIQVGAAPTFALGASFVRISDAAFATTPSNPGTSWIYEPDVDKGNQMAWAQPVSAGDFDLVFRFDWNSAVDELTLAGVGLTNAMDQLEIYGGVTDGATDGGGAATVRVRAPGTDPTWASPLSVTGSGTFRFTRTAGRVSASFEGMLVLGPTPLTADIQHLVIYTVRHRNPTQTFNFGEFGLDRVQLCY